MIWLENSKSFMPFQCSIRQAVLATLGFATAAFASSLVYSCFLRLHQHMSASLQFGNFSKVINFLLATFAILDILQSLFKAIYLISFANLIKKGCLILPVRVKMLAIFGDPKTQKS